MRKTSSFLFALLVATCLSLSSAELKANGVGKPAFSGAIETKKNAADPPKPTGVVCSNITQNSIQVSWTDNTGGTAWYYVYVKGQLSAGTTPNVYKIYVPNGTSTVNITGLVPGTYYWFVVEANNGSGYSWSDLTGGVAARTLAPQPPAPTSLVLDQVGFNTLHITWGYPITQLINRYTVERSFDGTNWSQVVSNYPTVKTDFLDSNLPEGATMWYRVRGWDDFNGGGPSNYSNVVVGTTLKHTPPAGPTLLAVNQSVIDPQRWADLSWRLGPQNNATQTDIPRNMQIWRSTTSATTGFIQVNGYANLYPSPDPNAYISYTDKNLTAKTKYWYKVVEQNAWGTSIESNVIAFTTAGPPYAPNNLTAIAGTDAINNSVVNLNWTNQSTDESAILVERSMGDSLHFSVYATLAPKTQSLVVLPLEEGVMYYFRVRAINKYGSSNNTPAVGVTSVLTKAPNAPFFLSGTASAQGQVTLNWSDGSNNEAKFEVERSTDSTAFAKIGETLRNVTTYVDNGLSDNTAYYYRVRAVNSLGNSPYATVKVTTKAKSGIVGGNQDELVIVAYPNPTLSTVKITAAASLANEIATVRVIDNANREVLSKSTRFNSASELTIDMSGLNQGIYTLNIQSNASNISKRIVKN